MLRDSCAPMFIKTLFIKPHCIASHVSIYLWMDSENVMCCYVMCVCLCLCVSLHVCLCLCVCEPKGILYNQKERNNAIYKKMHETEDPHVE